MIVSGAVVRPLGYESFADLTPVPVVAIRRDGVEFDGDLEPDVRQAVWWRITSRNDADETARRHISGARDAIGSIEVCADPECVCPHCGNLGAVSHLLMLLANDRLGDQ